LVDPKRRETKHEPQVKPNETKASGKGMVPNASGVESRKKKGTKSGKKELPRVTTIVCESEGRGGQEKLFHPAVGLEGCGKNGKATALLRDLKGGMKKKTKLNRH